MGKILTRAESARAKGMSMVALPSASRLDLVSPNWCDKTTWYQAATEVTAETLTDSGDGLTFESTHPHWVDVMNGKLTGEHALRDTYKPVVKVGGVEKTEDSPGLDDGDYDIDYEAGTVTFHTAPGQAPVVDYYYASSSLWKITPTEGKVIRLAEVEVQFSDNIEMKGDIVFQVTAGGQVVGENIYQTIYDFINASSLSYPAIPQLGGSGWRGMKGPVYLFRWPYLERGALDLYASMGMEVSLKIGNDEEFTGDLAIATFYGTSESETE